MNLYTYFKQKYLLKNYNVFIWDSKKSIFRNIKKFKAIPLNLLIGIDKQKNNLWENTVNFAKGNYTNNALLWGTRGNGKSTLIKSVFHSLTNQYINLKLIQINKDNIIDIEKIYNIIEKKNKFRFIIYIDDLSFEKIDSQFKLIKSTLDGSTVSQPTNVILYATSNRRHLIPRDMIENERSSAIHADESVEEKVSLSDRFGLWIGFHNISQETYLEIIKSYLNYYKIDFNDKVLKESIQWSLIRGNRNGRTAWQYIINIASKNDLKINI